MSLIGLLMATEKQLPLGRLNIKPIKWHLKNQWRVPKSLEKVIPVPRALHPPLQWWTKEANILRSTPASFASHPPKSLQTPQAKAGVLTWETSWQTGRGQSQKVICT